MTFLRTISRWQYKQLRAMGYDIVKVGEAIVENAEDGLSAPQEAPAATEPDNAGTAAAGEPELAKDEATA